MSHIQTAHLTVLSVCVIARGGEFAFRDEATCDDRSVMQFRPVVLTTTSSAPLAVASDVAFDATYGLLLIGPGPDSALQLVWNTSSANSSGIWIDLDRDGRLAHDERITLDSGRIEVPIQIPIDGEAGGGRLDRTLVLRRSIAEEGLLYAVRGYTTGMLAIGETEHRAALIDGDANGLFDGPAADRLWLDLNDDGHFDALSEHFLLGTPLTIDAGIFTVSTDPAGRRPKAHRRSDRTGWLNLALGVSGEPLIEKASVEIVSDLGELKTLRQAEGALRVPVASYRIARLTLQIKDSEARLWEYQFAGRGSKYDYQVNEDAPTTVDLLAGIEPRVDTSVRRDSSGDAAALVVTPMLTTGCGLNLTNCSVQRRLDAHPISTSGEIRLLGSNGNVVSTALSGFA